MLVFRLNVVLPGEKHKGLCHFNTEEKKKKEIIPFPGPSPNPNPNCKHKVLTIWLRVTADDCGPRTSCPPGHVVLGPNVPCQDRMSPLPP